MAISTYADLVSEVTDWLNDAIIASKVPTFIQLTEAKINRNVRLPEMEVSANIALSSNQSVASLPDMIEPRSILLTANGSTLLYNQALAYTSLANINEQFAGATGYPTRYATVGTTIRVGPTPTVACNLLVSYYQKVPNLTQAAPTNWLLTLYPDIYLLGCLVAAELRGWNDERLPLLKASFDEMLTELTAAALKRRYGGTPLAASNGIRQVAGPST